MKNRISKFLRYLDFEFIFEGFILLLGFTVIGSFLYIIDFHYNEINKKVVSMEVVDKYVIEAHLDCSANDRTCSYVEDVYTLKVKNVYDDNSVKEEEREVHLEYFDKVNVGDVLDNGIIK